MMNLLANMDLKNIKIENLAKAKNDFEFCWPPSEDGGNSNGGNSNGDNSNGDNSDGGNSDGGNSDGGNSNGGNSDGGNSNGDNSNGDNSKAGELLNRNAALAHSIRKK